MLRYVSLNVCNVQQKLANRKAQIYSLQLLEPHKSGICLDSTMKISLLNLLQVCYENWKIKLFCDNNSSIMAA